MKQFNLLAMLQSSGGRMTQELNERLITHPGEMGKNREEIVRQFLRNYLPKRFEVSSGFAFDSHKNMSQQLDIVIAESTTCPHFETRGGIRLFPCESVVAVGQIKSSLTSRKQLKDALANLASAKILDRSANGHAFDETRQATLDPRNNHLHQIFSFLFVIGRVLDADAVRHEMLEYLSKTPVQLWPNVVFACDKYLITYCCDEGVCPNPMHARGVAIQRESGEQDILLKLYLLLGRAIEQVPIACLPYWEYLNQITSWSADVAYSTYEYPPPFLTSLSIT